MLLCGRECKVLLPVLYSGLGGPHRLQNPELAQTLLKRILVAFAFLLYDTCIVSIYLKKLLLRASQVHETYYSNSVVRRSTRFPPDWGTEPEMAEQ